MGFDYSAIRQFQMQIIADIVPTPVGKECRIRFRSSPDGHTNWGYALWRTPDGKIQASENRTLETMGLAQNWIIDPADVLEGDINCVFPYLCVSRLTTELNVQLGRS